MLRFCANLSMLFTEVPMLERFALAKAHGFNAVEIQFPYDWPVEQLQAQLDTYQLELILMNVGASDLLQGGEGLAAVPHRQPEFVAALDQACSYAQQLKPRWINVLPGRCYAAEHTAAYQQTLVNNLRLAADRFAELGIGCVFEAINSIDMPGFLIASSQQALDLLAEVNHPNLKLQFDIYHRARMAEDPLTMLQDQLAQIGHIQFADCPGRGEPGSGQLDFAQLFDYLTHVDYDGWVGAEYRPTQATTESMRWMAEWIRTDNTKRAD